MVNNELVDALCLAANEIELSPEFQALNSAIETAKNVVLKTLDAIQSKSFSTLPLPVKLWSAERDLKSFIQQMLEFTDKVRSNIAIYRLIPGISDLIAKMLGLSTSINKIYSTAKRRGFTNRTLTAASLNLIRNHGVKLFEVAETLELVLDPLTDEGFRLAREEYAGGSRLGLEVFN